MIVRRGQCITEERTVNYWGEDSVLLRRGQCVTEKRTVCY